MSFGEDVIKHDSPTSLWFKRTEIRNSQSIFMNPNHLKFLLAINDVRFWFRAEIVRFSVAIGNIKFFIKTEADGLCQPS